MKRFLIPALIVAAALVILLLPERQTDRPVLRDETETGTTGQPAQPAAVVGDPDLEAVASAIHDYQSRFGANPAGDNAAIARALAAANLPANERGELIDRWGTPLLFRPQSDVALEIRSAGPDKTMGTADDLVTR